MALAHSLNDSNFSPVSKQMTGCVFIILILSQIVVYVNQYLVNQYLGLITIAIAEIMDCDIDLMPCCLFAKLTEHI